MKKGVWMVMSLVFAVAPLLIALGAGHGLAPLQKWVARYNGPGNSYDYARAIAVDGSGNVYVTGESKGSGTDYDYATIKYSAKGKQLWVQRYNGPGNDDDKANAIAVDRLGNVYVTGESDNRTYSSDFATIKYNAKGKQLWVKRYNGPGNGDDEANAIAVDGSGNVYVTGYSEGSGSLYDYATIKYSASGKQLWVKRYNGPGNGDDEANAIAVDRSGNVYVTGESMGSGTEYDYATIKYSTNGKQLWVNRYNEEYEIANAITVDGSGNVYVAGYNQDSGTPTTIKYSPNGKQLWATTLYGPGSGGDYTSAIAVDGTGNVYVSGYTNGYGTSDYLTIKYSANGSVLWVKTYDGPGNNEDSAYDIAIDGSGNVYVTGYSRGSGSFNDYATIKYSTNGEQLWVKRYNGLANSWDEASAIAVDGSGNVYVTGWSEGSSTDDDYATIKY